MLNILKTFKSKHALRRAKSFKYAFDGIFHALINEPNFRIQVAIAFVSTIAGIYFKISNTEWGMLVISMGLLLSAEMINTVVEEIMDFFFKEYDDVAKVIKDLSAGYVLVMAVSSLIILYLIFGTRFIQ